MTDTQKRLMAFNKVKSIDKPKPVQPNVVYLSREDFDLLDVTTADTVYYVTEPNGNVTMMRGDNR